MKTAQRIGVLLLLAAVSGCGSRKALTRTHYAERDSIMAITQKEARNTRQCTGKQAEVIEVDLPCRPCTKDGHGKCKQSTWQKCMVDILPKRVVDTALRILDFKS